MKNEDAIRILERRSTIPDADASWNEIMQAIDMAIEALKAERHEEWEYDDRSGQFICSKCEGGVNMPTLMGEPLYKWCPWCGAKMGGDEK